MENREKEAHHEAPQTDWQTPETNESLQADPTQFSGVSDEEIARTNEEVDERIYASDSYQHVSDGAAFGQNDDPDDDDDDDDDEDEDDDDDEDEDETSDWGHVDPLDGNSPFPDPMDPAAPGSAV